MKKNSIRYTPHLTIPSTLHCTPQTHMKQNTPQTLYHSNHTIPALLEMVATSLSCCLIICDRSVNISLISTSPLWICSIASERSSMMCACTVASSIGISLSKITCSCADRCTKTPSSAPVLPSLRRPPLASLPRSRGWLRPPETTLLARGLAFAAAADAIPPSPKKPTKKKIY